MKRAAILMALGLCLAGCGMRPLYGTGSKSAPTQTLDAVTIGPIAGRAGWLVRNALIERVGNHGTAARYRLDIQLDDRIEGYGIRADTTTTRERRTLRARYQLVDTQAETILLDATAGSDVGIDVVNSEYATIAAEQTALERLADRIADQIVARVALQARQTAAEPPAK